MRKMTFPLLAGAALATSGAALAQAHEEPQGDRTRAQVQERVAQAFQRMDHNGDGRLDAADRAARAKIRFDRADADGDGALSFDEFTAARASRGERRDGAAAERRDRMGHRGMRHAMGRNADADGDGAVTRAEFDAAALARFDAADADRNGILTAAERKAHRKQRRDHRGHRTS